ncbi:MAG: hypothetical protein M3Y09_10085, partial [Actinomycetota bacterium]|nr:hypothetical protein [Actinomycetota bacterium]
MTPNAGSYEQAKSIEQMMLGELGWLAPIGALTLAAILAVALAIVLPRHRQQLIAWWVAAGHLASAGLAATVWLTGGFRATMSGLVVVDGLSLTLTGIIGVSGALCVALARPVIAGTDREGEFYA